MFFFTLRTQGPVFLTAGVLRQADQVGKNSVRAGHTFRQFAIKGVGIVDINAFAILCVEQTSLLRFLALIVSFQQSIGVQWSNLVSAATPEDRDVIVRLVIFPNWEGQETLEQLQTKVRQRFEMLGAEDCTEELVEDLPADVFEWVNADGGAFLRLIL